MLLSALENSACCHAAGKFCLFWGKLVGMLWHESSRVRWTEWTACFRADLNYKNEFKLVQKRIGDLRKACNGLN